jgi:GT2 family glycosyltransferase
MTMVSAVVVAYGEEPWLERCVSSLLASDGVVVEVILVDNTGTGGGVDRLEARDGVQVVRPGRNLGFAGGCNLGARSASGDVIALVNQDALVEAATLKRLADVAVRPGVAIATASVRLAHAPDRLNSAGNDVHFLGFGWSGSYDQPAAARHVEAEAVAASGAGMAVRRELWEQLGGFAEEYFAYHEDAELSVRCWHLGLRVVYVPDAIVTHRYEFSRNPRKYFLVERNRLLFCLTLYETRTLLLLAPAFLCLELGMLAVAAQGGWLREKLAGWRWIARNHRWVGARRRLLQRERTRPDRELAPMLARRFDAGNLPLPQPLRPLDAALGAYWAVVLRLL